MEEVVEALDQAVWYQEVLAVALAMEACQQDKEERLQNQVMEI